MSEKRRKKRPARSKRVRKDPRVVQVFRNLFKIRWPIDPDGEPDPPKPRVTASPDPGGGGIH
jgi:hypothetical protein